MAAPVAEAKKLTSDQALKRAFENPSMKMRAKSQVQPRLAYTVNTTSDEEAVYVFNKGDRNGYLVISADDEFPAVLGYADSGTFSEADMAPALRWWLGEYAAKIAASRNSSSNTDKADASEDGRILHSEWEPIAPLLTSKWNQSAPYNLKCPTDTKTGTKRSVTGCVATALAQLMYYHKWPAKGTGTHTYKYTRSDKTENTITIDFSEYTFDWDNMLDEYVSGKYTDPQGEAVANLMYACGAGVDMKYSSSASSAQTIADITALTTYFDYSKDMRFKYRDATSFSGDWEAAIYESLKNKRPVIYSGASDSGGHSFICDGYDEDGYFHFNWGWAGSSDGYYRVDLLNPSEQGIGGSGAGYNARQMVILNIHPAAADDKGTPQRAYMGYKGDFSYGTYQKEGKDPAENVWYVDEYGTPTGFYNKAPYNIQCKIGLVAYDKDGKEYPLIMDSAKDYKPNYGSSWMRLNMKSYMSSVNIPAGTYTVYPAVKYADNGEVVKMTPENGWRDHLIMKLAEDGTFTVSEPEVNPKDSPEVLVSAFRYQGEVYRKTPKNITISFSNLSDTKDLYGGIWMLVYPKGDLSDYKDYVYLDEMIPASRNLSFTGAYEFDLDPGEYEVWFIDARDKFLSGSFPLVISEGSEAEIKEDLQFVSFSPLLFEPNVTEKTQVKFTLKNVGTESVVSPRLKYGVGIYSTADNKGRVWTIKYSKELKAGNQMNYSANLSNVNLDPGEYYVKLYWYNDEDDDTKRVAISPKIYVTAGYEASKIDMEKAALNVSVGEKVSAVATVSPVDAANTIKWHTENPEVATVDDKGEITGVAEGKTLIVAYAPNGIFDKCEVTVTPKGGIEDIIAAGKAIKAVYTIGGDKVLDRPQAADLMKLDKGVYVVVTEDGSFKYVR